MKKFAFTVLAAATTFAATIPVAHAQSTASTFAVTATLTSRCIIGTFSGTGVAFGAVTAFVAPTNATTTATIRCTRGIANPTMIFDTTNGTTTAVGTAPTGAGVLPNGLRYTLSAALGTPTPGIAPTAASLNAQDSTDTVVTVTGAMEAQAGANSGANTHNRIMTVAF